MPPESPYAHMLDDMPTLLDALQARACAQSPDSTLTAVAFSKPWAMVACIEYGEDPDFPICVCWICKPMPGSRSTATT